MGAKSSTGKGGKRKHGRGLRSPSHKRYNTEMRWLKNKIRRLQKHMRQHPKDNIAKEALENVY